MRALASVLVIAAAAWAAPVAAQYYGGGYGPGSVVRCESNDGRSRECPMDTRYGVQLVRQISKAACIEGRSWGIGRNGVWVAQGCRADFQAGGYGGPGYGYGDPGYGNPGYGNPGYGNPGYGAGGYGQVVRCESNKGNTRECRMNTRGGVQLVRQLSSAACIEGHSWGISRNGVWVSQGCRAEFQSGGGYGNRGSGVGYGYGNLAGQTFRCESENGRLRQCPADTRGGVQLVRQLSKAACVQGRSWGFGNNGIWVSDGCRGEFVAGSRGSYGYGNNRYYGGNSGYYGGGHGQTFRCESHNNRHQRCNIGAARGVQLVRQISGAACIEGRTWGRDAGGVWVSQGCRGEFRAY